MNDYYNLLNCDEHLNEKIDVLIDVFTRYYGETRRKEAEEKFRNAILIGYITPSQMKSTIYSAEKKMTNELFDKVLSETNSSLSTADITNNTSFRYNQVQPMYYFYEFYRQYLLGEEGRRKEYLKETYESLKEHIPELTEEEFEEMVKNHKVLDKYKNIKAWLYNNLLYSIDVSNSETKYQRAFENAQNLLHKIDDTITIDNFSEFLDNNEIKALIHVAESYPGMLKEYEETMGPGTELHDLLEQYEAFEKRINDKYFKQYILENLDLVPEINRDVVKEYILSGDSNITIDNYIKIFFPDSVDSIHPLEIFSEEQDKVLEDPEESTWRKDNIRKRRIEYYNTIGIKLGNDYESYASSDVVKRYTPSYEDVKMRVANLEDIRNRRNNELFNEDPKVKRIRQRIESVGLLDKDDSFNARRYNDDATGTLINPNIVRTNTGYQVYPILIMKFSNNEYVDHDLLHELNHIFELALESIRGEEYTVYCGWEIISTKFESKSNDVVDTLDTNIERRDYELFNEIINELIAQDIGNAMHEAGIYIFNTKENASMKNSTAYEYSFFLVRDFFKEFKQKIIESRSNGNIRVIWDEVGKENFDALNNLFKIYNDHFGGLEIYGLLDDIKNERDTEKTRIYNDLIRQRDEILERMNKHSMLRRITPTYSEEDTKTNK